MPRSRSRGASAPAVARTIRFPEALRARLADDARRCGRSFEAHVIAILRRHFGEDVDVAPAPDTLLALAVGSLTGASKADRALLTRRLVGGDVE